MPNNLHLYHLVLQQLCQWLPQERITRMRNLALLMSGLGNFAEQFKIALLHGISLLAGQHSDNYGLTLLAPDCGLRTRSWEVSYQKLRNLIEGTRLAEAALQ